LIRRIARAEEHDVTRRTKFRRIFGQDPEADVEAELSFHLEMRIRELVEQGMTPERAREVAVRRFGDYEHSRRECLAIGERLKRRLARAHYLAELRQDCRYALRMMRASPGFTAVAVLTLALGLGANSAIFSVVHGVLLESLPYRDADRLHWVRMLYPDGTAYSAASAPDFMSVRAGTRVFEQVDAYTTGIFTLIGAGEPQEIRGASVSDGLLDLLGVQMAIGRGFSRDENQPGRTSVALLSHGFWQRQFAGDRRVLGRSLSIAGKSYSVVGVLAPGARLPSEADVWMPLAYDATFSAATAQGRRSEFLAVLGRARPGLTSAQVDADLRRLGTELQGAFPSTNASISFNAKPLRDVILGDVRTPLLVLFGAVACVLLVACANVANLLLARSSARQGELAVRAALGAGRGRLMRQLLAEAILLGLVGGAVGLAIAYWGTAALVAASPADLPRLDAIRVNGRVVLFTFAMAVVTSLLFGMLPAFQATRRRLTGRLQDAGRSAAGSGGHRVRASLIVAEMALAVVLLTGAGLLIRSFVQLTRVPTGFQAEQAMAFRLALQGSAYPGPAQLRSRVAELEERVRALPGVLAEGATSQLPATGLGSIINFTVDGAPPPPPDVNAEIAISSITPDYFATLGAPLRAGRGFSSRDHGEAPPVAIINEAGARRWFGSLNPLGRHVTAGAASREIVGIVADVLQRHPGEPARPQLFVPYAQRPTRQVRFVVRAASDPLRLAAAIRGEIRARDPDLAIAEFTPLDQLVARSLARPHFYTSLLSLFAAVALILAATGVFGVMSYAVAQRSREIGIRRALGAHAGDVLRIVVGTSLALAGAGLVLGLAAALALGRLLQQQLFGVSVVDPVTIGAVILVLSIAAGAATVLPARRALAVDPATALRDS
jgi:predicted permease